MLWFKFIQHWFTLQNTPFIVSTFSFISLCKIETNWILKTLFYLSQDSFFVLTVYVLLQCWFILTVVFTFLTLIGYFTCVAFLFFYKKNYLLNHICQSYLFLSLLPSYNFSFCIFTDTAFWAGSVIESQCPSWHVYGKKCTGGGKAKQVIQIFQLHYAFLTYLSFLWGSRWFQWQLYIKDSLNNKFKVRCTF